MKIHSMSHRLSMFVLFISVLSACAPLPGFGQGQDGRHEYPLPPRVGAAEQQARLAEIARNATLEADDEKRARMIVELASHMWSMLPERYGQVQNWWRRVIESAKLRRA